MIKDSNNIKPDYPSTTTSGSINNSADIASGKYPITPKLPVQKNNMLLTPL